MTIYKDVETARGNEARTTEFRALTSVRGRLSSERQNLALHLARDAFDRQDFVEAETWALRALNDGPQVDALCLLGDICQDTFDLKNALHWYELACACAIVRRFDDSSIRDNRQARLQAIRREIREEWVHRAPLREINFQAANPYFARAWFGEVVQSKRDDDVASVVSSCKILVEEESKLADGAIHFLRTAVLDDDLEFISFRPDLKLPHEPNLSHAMWVLPVHQVPEFGDVLLLSSRAAKAAAQAKNATEFVRFFPEDAKFGAFTGTL